MFEFEKKGIHKKANNLKSESTSFNMHTKKTSPLLKRITKEELIKNLNDSRLFFLRSRSEKGKE